MLCFSCVQESTSGAEEDQSMAEAAPDAAADRHKYSNSSAPEQQQQLPEHAWLFGMDGVDPHGLSGSTLRAYFARQLMQPEWMTDIPADLASSWCVMSAAAHGMETMRLAPPLLVSTLTAVAQ
jgi:hypothetical protein